MGRIVKKRLNFVSTSVTDSGIFQEITEPVYDDDTVQERYETFLQQEGLSRDLGGEFTDSESEFSDDSEDLEEWITISKQMIDSSDDSEDDLFFQCDLCDKFYQRKDNLIIHLFQKHTKKHQCPQESCQKRFVARSDLENHLKTHDQGLNHLFSCNICNRRFIEENFLQTHNRRDHGQVCNNKQ